MPLACIKLIYSEKQKWPLVLQCWFYGSFTADLLSCASSAPGGLCVYIHVRARARVCKSATAEIVILEPCLKQHNVRIRGIRCVCVSVRADVCVCVCAAYWSWGQFELINSEFFCFTEHIFGCVLVCMYSLPREGRGWAVKLKGEYQQLRMTPWLVFFFVSFISHLIPQALHSSCIKFQSPPPFIPKWVARMKLYTESWLQHCPAYY